MDEQLFVYGTLRDPEWQLRLIGRTLNGVPDTLHDFRRYQLPEYPVALPYAGASIDGMILTITPDELAKFDVYEGNTYFRIRVTLASGTETWFYQGDPAYYAKMFEGQ